MTGLKRLHLPSSSRHLSPAHDLVAKASWLSFVEALIGSANIRPKLAAEVSIALSAIGTLLWMACTQDSQDNFLPKVSL